MIYSYSNDASQNEALVNDVDTLLAQMTSGATSSESVVNRYLERIDDTDTDLRAWQTINEKYSIAQARAADNRRNQSNVMGPLHGVPVGIKDVIDTVELTTQLGSSIYSGRFPEKNAAVIDKLLAAGAIILGKTVTTELAWLHQSATRNAVNREFSPGGSSSGSAAAVAAGQVPLAIGTQTGGSVIRPASYNGIFGLKPSRGLISRQGVLQTSQTLDQLGVFGNSLADVCTLADTLIENDARNPHTYPGAIPSLKAGHDSEVHSKPDLVWIDMPYRDRYSNTLNARAFELCDLINNRTKASLDIIPAPSIMAALPNSHLVIYDVEILQNLNVEWKQHRDQLSQIAKDGLKRAETRTKDEYEEALGIRSAAIDWFDTFFQGYDGILTPSAPDIAPRYGEGTGDSICCVVWTLCGLPCVSMPLLTGDNNMPLGIQLVGAYKKDDQLMRTASWLLNTLKNEKLSRS